MAKFYHHGKDKSNMMQPWQHHIAIGNRNEILGHRGPYYDEISDYLRLTEHGVPYLQKLDDQ